MTFDFLTALLAMGAPPAQPGTQPNPKAQLIQMILMFGFLFVVMWLFMFRPQQKKAKEHKEMMSNLKQGDKVLTSGGILGVVVSIKDKTVSIRSADAKLEVLKSAVTEILEKATGSAEAKPSGA
jgi:preprotein translocase subunit YajC